MYKNSHGKVFHIGDICKYVWPNGEYTVRITTKEALYKAYPQRRPKDTDIPGIVIDASPNSKKEIGQIFNFYYCTLLPLKRKEFIPDKEYEGLYE